MQKHKEGGVTEQNKGYHLREIQKGVLGTASKVREEAEEFADAVEQGCKIMSLVELSDLYGAMEAFLHTNFGDVGMEDLKEMSDITKRAFTNGHRL